ncbi:MAG: tRNA threonylcarbamoyladenosine dehydratase [Ruminococcaceae bacterium]|nr:tRNA threonylcarbamoyladenosine dehydratase [Oscillospiraceae bacterium]
MNERFEREAMLLGQEAVDYLATCRVALFGVGGVGSYAAEALARSGVGMVELVDGDTVCRTNINRQLIALESTVGRAKVEVAAERMRDINPEIRVICRREVILPETAQKFDFSAYDFVIDAIDTVSGKLAIAEAAVRAGVPMICCMGTGNKSDPTALRVTDLSKTSVCPLARVMRRELKKRGILHLPVIYSEEPAMVPMAAGEHAGGKVTPGSLAFVPSVAGLIAAAEAVKCLLKRKNEAESGEAESEHE